MATSKYFNNFESRAEQQLYENLIGEVVKIWGIDTQYIIRSSGSSFDLLFGDDPTKKFELSYPVEAYIENVDKFDGNEFYSKFGLEIRKEVSFIMPNRAFKKAVPSEVCERPREGDLLWLKNFNALFEIKFVDNEKFFYYFGKRIYGYKINCEVFRYSNEVLNTGNSNIDDIENKKAIVYTFTMSSANTQGTYMIDEKVYQGSNLQYAIAEAEVARWNKPSLKLELKNIKGIFSGGVAIKGVKSNASFVLASSELLEDKNSPLDNNKILELESDLILDFSENNPFGEP